jgi:hypothetical protein
MVRLAYEIDYGNAGPYCKDEYNNGMAQVPGSLCDEIKAN